MAIDVIIPVYNGARFLARSVGSALGQVELGERELRVICVDDASTDGSAAVLAELALSDTRVRVLTNPRNEGVSVSRNRAIAASDGELIAPLDQDDEWPADKLALQLAELDRNTELGYVVGKQRMILEPGSQRPAWCRPEWLTSPQAGYIPGALLVRRSTWDRVGPFDTAMSAGGDDTDWFARARRMRVPHVSLDTVVLHRYVHDSNLSSEERTNAELLALVRRHVDENRGG